MDDTLIEVEDRTYVNPQKGLDERMQFIDTLRDVQAQNTAQINQNTYNLGSPVTSNVGGLGGSEGLWKAQYQTPQTNAQIADLKTIANEYAKKQIMQNLNDIVQNRYKQAVRSYGARAKARSSSGGGTGTGTDPLQQIIDGLNLNTNTQNPNDWEVVYDEAKLRQLRDSGDIAAYQAALNAYNAGGNAQAFKYNQGDNTYYGTLYRDSLGKVTGANTYRVVDGNLQPVAGYDKNVQTTLNNLSGGKLYNLNGVDITNSLRF